MTKIKSLIIILYFAPIMLSLYMIAHSGYLLGDFRSERYELTMDESFFVILVYFLPLLVLYLLTKVVNKIEVTNYESNNVEKIIFYSLIFVGVVTLFFGANKIGQDAIPGFDGLLVNIASKLNPLAMLMLLSFAHLNLKKFLLCIIIVLFYGYRQESLQGYLVVAISFAIYILINYKINNILFCFLLIIPVVFLGPIIDLLSFLYSLRNESRGVTFNIEEISSLLVGRVSSVSSYIYISSFYSAFNGVSDYFSISVFIERLTGLQLFHSVSPSEVFNAYIVGPNAGYSIFMGLPGFISFLVNYNGFVAAINIIFLLFILSFMYYLIPVVNKPYRTAIFFMVIYLTLLSSDIWELSILFQSIILWKMIAFLANVNAQREIK